MAYERTRQKLGFGPEVPDSVVLREGFSRARQKRPGMTATEYRQRLDQYEGAGAAAAPQATPPPTPAVAGGNQPAPAITPYSLAKGAVEGIVGDATSLARGLTTDPMAQMKRAVEQRKLIVEPTPEEAERARRGLAALGGGAAALLSGGTIPAGVNVLTRVLRSGASGAAGGYVDAAIRSRGSLPETVAGTALGAVAGPVADEGMRFLGRMGRAAPPTNELRGPSPKAKNPLRSVGGRLEESGPEGREILRRVKEADTQALTEAGQVQRRLKDAGFRKLRHEEDRALGHALRGRGLPEDAMTPRAEAVRGEAREYLGGVVPRARGVDLPTGDLGEFYFPENMVDVEHLGRGNALARILAGTRRAFGDRGASANPIRDDVLENIQRLGAAPSPSGAESMVDDWINFVRTKGQHGGELAVPDPAQRASALRHYMERRANKNPNLDFSRDVSLPFYDPSPGRVLPRYIEGAERRIAEAGQYGPKGEKITGILQGITNPEDRARTAHLAKASTALSDEGDMDASRWVEKARRYMATKLNPASTVLNLSQNLNSLYGSDTGSFARGVARSMTRAGGDLAIDSGAITETALANVRHAIRPGHDFVDRYLKFIGFTPVERLNRRVAASVGWTYAQKMAKKLLSNPEDAFARKELAALELDADAIVQKGGLDDKDLIRAAKVFVDRTQFRQREIDLPDFFTSSAIGRNATQFKGFSYQQSQFLAREILDGLRSNNPQAKAKAMRNAALVLTLAPLVGEQVSNARAFLLDKERKEGGLARYIENLANAGGLGIMLDALNATEFNALGYLAGPTASTVADVAETGRRAIGRAIDKGKGPTPGEKRTLTRALPGGAIVARRLFPDVKKGGSSKPQGRPARPDKERPVRQERSR